MISPSGDGAGLETYSTSASRGARARAAMASQNEASCHHRNDVPSRCAELDLDLTQTYVCIGLDDLRGRAPCLLQ